MTPGNLAVPVMKGSAGVDEGGPVCFDMHDQNAIMALQLQRAEQRLSKLEDGSTYSGGTIGGGDLLAAPSADAAAGSASCYDGFWKNSSGGSMS